MNETLQSALDAGDLLDSERISLAGVNAGAAASRFAIRCLGGKQYIGFGHKFNKSKPVPRDGFGQTGRPTRTAVR